MVIAGQTLIWEESFFLDKSNMVLVDSLSDMFSIYQMHFNQLPISMFYTQSELWPSMVMVAVSL